MQCLRAMLVVAEERSFTQAAARLGLTQTAVSHQIAQLEAWIGTRLFVRDRNGVELTDQAVVVIPRIGEAMTRLQIALVAARATGNGRKLRVSTSPEFASQWLQPRLGAFCAAQPEIDVSMTVEYRRAGLDDAGAGVAIWLAGSSPAKDAIRLTDDYEFAVCSPAMMRELPPRDAIRAAPLLRYEGARHTVLDWRRWFEQIYGDAERFGDLAFDHGPSYATFTEMIAECRAGTGLALVRTSLVADELARGRLLKAFDETIKSDLQYYLVIGSSYRRKPEVTAFRAWLLQAMGLAR